MLDDHIDGWLEAEYADGFTLVQDNEDQSPYDEHRNIFHAILHDRPVAEHGRLTRLLFIVQPQGGGELVGWQILWDQLPEGSRPIRFMKMTNTLYADGTQSGPVCHRVGFGWQWTDDQGNHKDGVIIYPDLTTTPLADYVEGD